MQNMFSGCSALTSIPPLDAAAVTACAGIVKGCTNLTSFILTGLRRTGSAAGLSLVDTKMDATALDAFFTALGTCAETTTFYKTITVTGTPGAAGCDAAIATAKGWVVTK